MKKKHLLLVVIFIWFFIAGNFVIQYDWDVMYGLWIERINKTALINKILAFVLFITIGYYGVRKTEGKFTDWLNKGWLLLLLFIPFNGFTQMVQDSLSITDYLFVGKSWSMLGAYMIAALLGVVFRWSVNACKGVRRNKNSPNKLSWSYWWTNNLKRAIASVLTTIIALFVYLVFFNVGQLVNIGVAFVAGLASDILVKKIMKLKPNMEDLNND